MDTGSKNHKHPVKMKARSIAVFSLSLICFSASAQQAAPAETSSVYSNALFITLISIICLLLLVISVFANVVKAAAHHRTEQEKKKKGASFNGKILLVLILLGGVSNSLLAQTEAAAVTFESDSYLGMDSVTFYFMLSIIIFECFVIWMLYRISMQLLGVEERNRIAAEEKEKQGKVVKQPTFIEKLNASVAVEEEEDIMLDHNYDGIRELDNNLPPWWKYGFYLTIVFAVIYLIHFHVTKTGKLQTAEYEDQLAQAKSDMEEFSKKAANLVDENNATLLIDAASIASGKAIYLDNCGACHGRAGEGGVGPNLTDDYWIHSGGIKDIFKTIKYGYPEKGMKAWQQDLGTKQIHEVASFIKSLRGTNPPNGKEQQGELYKEENNSDSTKTISIDSTQVALKEK